MHRRTLLKGALGGAAALATPFAAPAVAQPGRTATLRLVPQSDLVSLDPIWTTATASHG